MAKAASTASAPPQAPHAARVARLAEETRSLELSHFLVTNPADVGYFTGFLGGDSVLVVGGPKPVVVSDFRYQEELEPLRGKFEVVIRKRSMGEALGELLAGFGGDTRIGIQAEHMTVAERDALAKKLGGPKKLASTTGVAIGMRRTKDASEVELIKKAIKIQQDALLAILPELKPGQSESDIAGRLEAQMKSRGASGTAFGTIVAARANGSHPHYHPSDKVKTAANQPLLIDWGAIYKGYRGDMTRTFTFGKWPKKIAEIYAIVLEAHELAAAALAPGKMTSDIDAIARKHIDAAGFGEHFGHGLGHGLGIDTHEEPRLSHMVKGSRLEPGHVVTIEPGIYLPGVGGVRIEDDYLITATGATNLCSLPRTMEWSTLS